MPTIRDGAKVAIIGSRNFPDLGGVRDFVNSLPASCIVVSGGAAGVDTAAQQAAEARGMSTLILRPNYSLFKGNEKAAPIARNRDIVRESDCVVAFYDGESKGTYHAIDCARKRFRAEGGPMAGSEFMYHTVIACCVCKQVVWSEYAAGSGPKLWVGHKDCVLMAYHSSKSQEATL